MCKGPESKDCISCLLTRFFDNGTCVIQCDPGKYQRDGQCHLCHHTCLECKDEGPDKCTRCGEDRYGVERYLFEGECRDSCPEGYYHSSSGTCDPCPPNCTVCISTDHCLYCAPSYYPTDGKCVKLQCGEGVNPDQEDCVTCEEGCEKCLSEHCMSCLPGYYQLGSSCRKMCPARTFEDELSMRCARCDDHCVTCDDSECYLCDDSFLLSDGTCVETCPEGFYSDMKQECEPCHSMCRSCGGPNLDDCDSCEDDMSLKDGQCIGKSKMTCSDGFFPNVGCEQCHSSCKSCLGPEEDQCDSCHEGIFLTTRQTCVSACPAGTHGNQTSGRCEDCSAGCVVCQDAHHCLKCKAESSQLYLQDGKCVAECTRGYPEDDACQSCATGCASCEGEANNCLSCDEDYLRFKHTCVQHCPEKHFVKDGVCERCPAHCTQCDQTQKCNECAEYYFLHEDGCHDDCPEGFFTNIQEKRCESCHSECSTCDGPDPDDCISCKSSRAARYNRKCLNKCPSDTYLDEIECRDCDRSCLTCSGPGPSSCLTCRTDMRKDVNGHCVFFSDCPPQKYTDKNGKCRPCHPTCLHCSGAGKEQCITCNPKHFLLNQTCVSTCPGGYHGDEKRQECVSCHKNCASCSGHHSNECLTCKPDLFLHGHSCVSTCPNSYFVNSSSGACQACDHTCEHCSESSGFCLSCRDGYFLMTTSGLCLHTCPSHYFPDTDRKCTHCHPTCKTCSDSGAVFCTSCYEGYEMFAGICTSRCLSGQYLTNDTCVACDQSCTECKGPGPYNCTRCPALQRLTEDGRCLSCCGENTFRHSRFPWECCVCDELDDECIVGLNHDFFSKEPLPSVRPGLVVFTVIFVLVSLWFAIFYFLHFRRRITSKPVLKTNGYAKIPDGPFSSASLKDSIHPEYRDKDQDQEDDEDEEDDIVYMGRDGIVYRKFKYSMLEEDEPEEEAEYEYEDEMYTFK